MPIATYDQDNGDGDGSKCHAHLRRPYPTHDGGAQARIGHASNEMELPRCESLPLRQQPPIPFDLLFGNYTVDQGVFFVQGQVGHTLTVVRRDEQAFCVRFFLTVKLVSLLLRLLVRSHLWQLAIDVSHIATLQRLRLVASKPNDSTPGKIVVLEIAYVIFLC